MNNIRKKCMLITPCNVTFKISSGKELKPNTKSIEFVWTREILIAMNSGIRIFEIGSDGKQVQLNKSNFDKINVLMDYPTEEEEKKEETVEEKPVVMTETDISEAPELPADEPKIEVPDVKDIAEPLAEEVVEEPTPEETVDPAEEESPSEEDDEPEEIDMTPQEDPEAKYYQNDSEDDCDEEKEDNEDDEFNVD